MKTKARNFSGLLATFTCVVSLFASPLSAQTMAGQHSYAASVQLVAASNQDAKVTVAVSDSKL